MNTPAPYTLVVVDMQPDFETSRQVPLIANVRREVKIAAELSMPVVFLEMPRLQGWKGREIHHTHWELFEAAITTSWTVWRKLESNGAPQVAEACRNFNFPTEHFRVVGLYTHACIYQTVKGLFNTFSSAIIEVVADACSNAFASSHPERTKSIWNFFLRWFNARRVVILNKDEDTQLRVAGAFKQLVPIDQVRYPDAVKIGQLFTPNMGMAPLGHCLYVT